MIRVCTANKVLIRESILKLNLRTQKLIESLGSGSLDLVRIGCPIDGGCIVLHYDDIVGWGCAFDNKEFHLYVTPDHRNKGIGKRIIDRAKEDFPDHGFCPWDKRTNYLFSSKNCKIAPTYCEH